MAETDYSAESLAEDTLILRFGLTVDAATNARVHAAARALREAALPGVIDIAPAYASLLLRFDPFAWSDAEKRMTPHEHFEEALRAALAFTNTVKTDPDLRRGDESKDADSIRGSALVIEIPVCYGGEFGPDLADVATHADTTSNDVIARHTAAEYTVAMLGFAPGFPYLLGLDSALHMPRRTTPRTRVPAGSVAIGGAQTGIYPSELPGGWQLIGRTPLALFDPQSEPPCLLGPGDRVRFRAIDSVEFRTLCEKSGHGRTALDPRDQG